MEASTVRSCGSCLKPLPEDASFCPRCGAATPTGTDATTGVSAYAPGPTAAEIEDHRRTLQRALGDSCEVRGLLGRGGFAEVYLAWDPKLKRELAVKTLRPDIVTSRETLERFQREAEAIAKLRHPNVVPVYTVGEGAGLAYYTMPKVEGETLAAALKRDGKFSVAETVRILREAASALGSAHRAGIVHRDIKPENIMLEGPDRRVLVMDFGISKTMDGASGLTATGMLVGTPHFMSPEQALGERELGPASDQYSLAVVGYQMLTGRLPFEADTVQSLMFKQATMAAVPLLEVDPALPRAVAEPIERALAKDAERRYATIEEFGAALAAAVERAGLVSGGWSRQLPEMRARVAAMRAELPGWKHPLTLAGLAGAVLFLGLTPRTVHPPAYQLAAQRDEAIFAAKTFLANRGIPGPYESRAVFSTRDSVHRYLIAALGPEEAARRAGDHGVWAWAVDLRPSEGPMWHLGLRPGMRLREYRRAIPDADSAPAVRPALADSLATQALVAHGWDPQSLSRLPDSTITLAARSDLLLRWRTPSGDVVREGRDTAAAEIHVRFTGEELTQYTERLMLPRGFHLEGKGPVAFKVAAGLGWFAGAIGGLLLIVVTVRRQRMDELQWKHGIRLALVVAGGLSLFLAFEAWHDLRFLPPDGPRREELMTGLLVGLPMLLVLAGGVTLLGYTGGESLASEHRPSAVSGARELLKGRLIGPEMAVAVTAGAIWAGITLAMVAGVDTGVEMLTGVKARTGAANVFGTTGWTKPIESVTVAPLVVVGVFFAQMVVYRWWKRPWLAILVPVVVAGLIPLGFDSATTVTRINVPLVTALLSVVLWRHGLLAAVTMYALFLGAWPPVALALYGGTAFMPTTLLAAVPAIGVAALGIQSYRRAVAADARRRPAAAG